MVRTTLLFKYVLVSSIVITIHQVHGWYARNSLLDYSVAHWLEKNTNHPFNQNSDNGFERSSYLPWDTNGHLQNPSNVTRICRALQSESDNGITQIIYYQAGIGTEAGLLDHLYGGGTGAGLSENIREAYAFIVNNYKPNDEIFLIGFSRGAFTARSIGAMINCIGLLTNEGMSHFYHIFKEWENQDNRRYRSRWHHRPASLPNRMHIATSAYAHELEKV
jgi:hypothetical protein